MEVYLAIAPQGLLMVLDVPQSKPKGAGVATSSTALTTSVPVPATTQSTPAASTPPRVTRAASKKATTTETVLPIRTTSVSVEVEQTQDVENIQIILPLPGPIFFIPFLRSSIPASLSFGLTPYLPYLSFDLSQFNSLSSLALSSPPKEVPAITFSSVVVDSPIEGAGSSPTRSLLPLPSSSPSSLDLLVARTIETTEDAPPISPVPMQSFVPSTKALSAPFMSTDEVDIFEARLASLFDLPSTSLMATDETEQLVLADSLLEIF
ncbi:mucin-5AC-like [Camellia sinensis]|uniref:mucin-5AC-like n=1 Tax=Camellia sinensis TaxID=4442 RepID=UPI00103673DB|nr:mucin-5AC-like [Camellia sinensis]